MIMRPGFDFYGVIASIEDGKKQLVKQLFGVEFSEDEKVSKAEVAKKAGIKLPDLSRIQRHYHIAGDHGLTDAELADAQDFLRVYKELGHRMYHVEESALSLPPIEGALEGLSHLVAAGSQPYVVSALRLDQQVFVREWMAEHELGQIPVAYADRSSGATKLGPCNEFNVDSFVDDDLSQVEGLEAGGYTKLFLYSNAQENIKPGSSIIQVQNWTELMHYMMMD